MDKNIIVRGAREHNLKNINVEVPKNKLVVFTGVSGSGKSSLAFDTIYAEGQRRYIESLSSYARQFLGIMSKPDVDRIDGLSPAISIDQKSSSRNPRSIVGTITEIYDYLRLLFARIGHPHCPNCGMEISKLSADEITSLVFEKIIDMSKSDPIKPFQFSLLSPVIRERKGEFRGLFENLRTKGYTNLIVDGVEMNVDDDIGLIKTNKHTISVIVDKFSFSNNQMKSDDFKTSFRSRLFSSIEQSLILSDGLIIYKDSLEEHLYSEKFSCSICNISLPEIEPRMFSFNSPIGACKTCNGLGTILKVDPELVFNKNLSIREGAILPFKQISYHETWFSRTFNTFLKFHKIDPTISLSQMDKRVIDLLLYGDRKMHKVRGKNRFGHDTVIFEKFEGVIKELEKRLVESSGEYDHGDTHKYMVEEVCETCKGKRLKKEVLSVAIMDKNIIEVSELSIKETILFINKLKDNISEFEKQIVELVLKEIIDRLTFLTNVGLDYLTLSRSSITLSGGEAQRIRLASQIGSGLTGVLYILDEPSIGLHPKDVKALVNTLKKLRDLGNTVIVVEHDRETIEQADYIIDFGPKAGNEGGKVVFKGNIQSLLESNTITGKYLKKSINNGSNNKQDRLLNTTINGRSFIELKGCKEHNLKNIDIKVPIGFFTCVTGVSGSGKSTLVVDTLYRAMKYYVHGYVKKKVGNFSELSGYQYFDSVYLVDQSPIGRTPRSNPVTYVGVFDYIREVFANTIDAISLGYTKSKFSFNVKGGRCERCGGAGSIKVEMQFLADVYVRCNVCEGKRYNSETLQIRYKGKTIYDVLKMTVKEAIDFFGSNPRIVHKLLTLQKVGLGYIELGQPAPTLSGGEAQRIKLADELSRKSDGRTLYILDEPTTGLHMYDVEKLINALLSLTEKGNTVVLIEHNVDVIRSADWIIDLGPEGGEKGGGLVYQGDIEGLKSNKSSYTSRYL